MMLNTFQPRKTFHRRTHPADGLPPAPPPLPPAEVIATAVSEDGMVVTLYFDQPLAFSGAPFDFSLCEIQFNDQNPDSATIPGDDLSALIIQLQTVLGVGNARDVNAQPAWLETV